MNHGSSALLTFHTKSVLETKYSVPSTVYC